jgi:hypothetical protein
MLRIEKESSAAAVTILRLIGRIGVEHIAMMENAIADLGTEAKLDLYEIAIVDLTVVRFLLDCENRGVELLKCPAYIREWIEREDRR